MRHSRIVTLAAILLLAALAVALAPQQAPSTAYRFQEVQPGIYSAIGTGILNVGSNSAVVVNKDDVLVVDSHITPEAARVMLREIKSITDKPVRFLVNTHFHFDHTDGNQVFGPDVQIVAHDFTRRKLAGDFLHEPIFVNSVAALPKQIADLEGRAAAEKDPAAKARLEQTVRVQRAYQEQLKEIQPTPPTIAFSNTMTLVRGGREIRLLFLGRGHTGGDVVVYLPDERVVCTGDLLVNGIANLVDGYVNDWPETLDKLAALDFDDVIPGHGEPFKGKERIGFFQAYLRDLWAQATTLHDAHVPSEDAAKQIDMMSHKDHFPGITAPGVNPFAVARMYAVMEGRAER
jgi:glyoxylase-like metal-dependent hydrolase (beta-lactamase superfamily II)